LNVPDEELGMEPPSCEFDADGNFVSRSYGSGFGGEFGGGAGLGLGAFFVIALLWAGVPLVIAASLASGRGESVGTAVLLTLALGWIGLAIVAFGQRRAADTVTSYAQPAMAGPGATDGDPMAERLRRIDDLHRQGLITDEERAQRRDAALDDL
jgi:hypothetical protein